jgi:small-conductance mechanosensitive channel
MVEILGITFDLISLITRYFPSIIAFLISLIIIKIFKIIVLKKLENISKKTNTDFDDTIIEIINSFGKIFYLIIAIYVAFLFVELPQLAQTGLYYLLLITVTFYSIRSVRKVAQYILKKSLKEKSGRAITGFFDLAITILLWSVAFLLVLANMGFDITTLIAGFGIGGIAIAFALQKVLEDVFSAFSLYYDKPFEIGDFIIIGNDMGVVKDIGIQSTRIKTLQGQELVISNKEMTSTRINNYKQMKKRRIVFSFGVTYNTPTKKLEEIPKYIKTIISKEKVCEFDRAHFQKYGDSSLIYEVVYHLTVPDYNAYMDTQEKINLGIKKKFEKEKIEFAFPTQTIYYSKME